MKRDDLVLVICVLGVVAYLCLVLSVLTSLGIMNQQVKQAIFKMYNVPLPKEKHE